MMVNFRAAHAALREVTQKLQQFESINALATTFASKSP
jgi:hypothetical protein